jgi:GNAT superfamily N-acetyltransferase
MLGRKETPAQNSLPNRYGAPRAGAIGMDSHAVADDCDTLAVYMEMYASLGAEWVRHGFFTHTASVLATDRAAHDAFVTMGFGRRVVVGVRPVDPVPPAPEDADVFIRPATGDDAEAVHLLELELDYWHSHPPMFMPVDPETNEPAWQFMQGIMSNPANIIWLGLQEDETVGMISLLPDGFIQGTLKTEGLVYLYQGIVNFDARGGRIGEALLSKALAWCKENGYTHCGLHYFSGNPVGGPFWRKHGFEAAQYGMQRIVDDRIAWARDWR